MARCENCDKGRSRGIKQRHGRGVASKKFEYRAKQTKRILKPNLHRSTVVVDGVKKKMMLCTKCLRKVKGKGKGK